jgi:hypothetical protein
MNRPKTAAEICQHHIDIIEGQHGVGPTTVANLRAAVLELLYLTRNTDTAARADRAQFMRDHPGVISD